MAIKNAKREMNNRGATFTNNGDVINGDKNQTYIFNNYIQVDTEFYNEITNNYGNDFGKQKGKPINTDFEIDAIEGETSTITRNEMLKQIITVIILNFTKDIF